MLGILPELIGKWYSRPVTSAKDVSAAVKGRHSKEFCYCKGGEHGQMVGCDQGGLEALPIMLCV